jgi:hypothetical protein
MMLKKVDSNKRRVAPDTSRHTKLHPLDSSAPTNLTKKHKSVEKKHDSTSIATGPIQSLSNTTNFSKLKGANAIKVAKAQF